MKCLHYHCMHLAPLSVDSRLPLLPFLHTDNYITLGLVGTGCPLSCWGEVWGGCHAHCPAKFLIFSLLKGLILVKFEWFD